MVFMSSADYFQINFFKKELKGSKLAQATQVLSWHTILLSKGIFKGNNSSYCPKQNLLS